MFVEPNGAEHASVTDLRTFEGPRPPNAMVLIGPEGGWDAREVDAAAAAGVTLVTFGARVLRADAAGAARDRRVALHLARLVNGAHPFVFLISFSSVRDFSSAGTTDSRSLSMNPLTIR